MGAMKAVLIMLAIQLVTVAASLYSINRLESQTREAQDRQFKAEMENVELRYQLEKHKRRSIIYL